MNKTKALVTGATGFSGSHLVDYLLTEDLDVYITTRHRSKTENIEHVRDKVTIVNADIRDGYSLQRVVNEIKPYYIFHLAGQSFVGESWNSPLETLSTNVLGCANMLEAVRLCGNDCKVHIAGSSEEYGFVLESETPITEDNPLRPMSPYGVSKVAQDLLGQQYCRSYGIPVVITRGFNHTGPRRGYVFASTSFARQLVMIKRGKQESVVHVGNLDAQRDYTDARDMARAYWLAITKGKAGEAYNVCSESCIRIGDMLEMLIEMSGVGDVEIRQDPDKMRPSDVPILLGSCAKFRNLTGWEMQYTFEETLRALLDYWEERI